MVVIELDENEKALREKFREKKEIANERTKETQKIETDIINEIASWKKDLPVIELTDEVAFYEAEHTFSYYLKWKKDEMYVAIVEERWGRNKIEKEVKVTDFFKAMVVSDEVLLKLKERIPGFIEYIETKI